MSEKESVGSRQIAQQLPEYGVVFHRVGREKKPVVGELVLGVCAKGIIVYEIKNQIRTVTRRFLWRETDSISTGVKRSCFFPHHSSLQRSRQMCDDLRLSFQRRKLIIECGGPSGKKHIFVTESSKIAQYLLNLCSAQHKFHSEMTSRQLNRTLIPGGDQRQNPTTPRCAVGSETPSFSPCLSLPLQMRTWTSTCPSTAAAT